MMKLKSVFVSIAVFISSSVLIVHSHADPLEPPSEQFFSLTEIKSVDKKELSPLEYVPASDGISLVFRSYLPQKGQITLLILLLSFTCIQPLFT